MKPLASFLFNKSTEKNERKKKISGIKKGRRVLETERELKDITIKFMQCMNLS